jgi:streptogramin lyase
MNASTGKSQARMVVAALALLHGTPLGAVPLVPGDIYVVRTCAARIDGASGSYGEETCVPNLPGQLSLIFGIAVGQSGDLFLARGGDATDIIRLDPTTGQSTRVIAIEWGIPWNVTVGPLGNLYVIGYDIFGASTLLRSDASIQSWTTLDSPSAPYLAGATDVAVSPAGELYVVQVGAAGYAPSGVLRVDPDTGARTLVSALSRPVGVAIGPTGDLFVLNVIDNSTLRGQIVRVNPVTGARSIVSSSDIHACEPHVDGKETASSLYKCGGIDVAPNGELMTFSSDLRLIAIDPATGARRAASRSQLGPSGGAVANLAVIPVPPAILTGAGSGGGEVRAFHWRTGRQLFAFAPYGTTSTSGARVAAADMNRDGVPEVITGTGGGVPALVKVFDGRSLFAGQPRELYTLLPFGETAGVGVFVSASDLNGDGKADVLVSAGEGDQPRVRTFNGANGAPFGRGTIGSFLAYPQEFSGGSFVSGYR